MASIANNGTLTAVHDATDGENGFEELNGAHNVATVEIGGTTYALVPSFRDSGVQVILLVE